MAKKKNIVAIVGRPNVGKSTLFNRLLGKNKSIVENFPGVTRDRLYAEARHNDTEYILVDTGGLLPGADSEVTHGVHAMAEVAVREADSVIFLMDVREGLLPIDSEIYTYLLREGKRIYPVVNKADGPKQENDIFEFYALGAGKIYPVSAQHKIGVDALMDDIIGDFASTRDKDPDEEDITKIAIVGRPNVGKSSLLNRLLGFDRALVSETPGTTRDPIDSRITRDGTPYLLIDTAGIRRKSKIFQRIEQFSVLMSLKSIDRADIALLMLDGVEGATDQDAKVARFIHEKGKGAVILVNKWDLVPKDEKTSRAYTERLREDLIQIGYAPIVFTSAVTGKNLHQIFSSVEKVLKERSKRIGTGELNAFIEQIKKHYSPGIFRGHEIKIFYATQVDTAPPTFLVFTNYPKGIKPSYERYMVNRLRDRYGFTGNSIRLVFKARK
jgi:GTP-binding protein